MERYVGWFFSIIRIAGASFPVASSFVQLQAEIASEALITRVAKLEVHDDVPELSREIYHKLKAENSAKLYFEEKFYIKYSRALAALEAHGYIKGGHAPGKDYAVEIRLVDPSYIMYLCALEEDNDKMESLIQVVDNCKVGEWLDGNSIQRSIDLPLPAIEAVFDIYESKGYGLCLEEIGSTKYMGKA
jgi:hypothetical protein